MYDPLSLILVQKKLALMHLLNNDGNAIVPPGLKKDTKFG